MKKILIATTILLSTTSLFANEVQDELKDVKTPTALTTLLGSIKLRH